MGIQCGIAFTMSLFIGSLAFDAGALESAAVDLMVANRIGILAGTTLSAVFGSARLRGVAGSHDLAGQLNASGWPSIHSGTSTFSRRRTVGARSSTLASGSWRASDKRGPTDHKRDCKP